ncbi:hypothetical protein CL614_09670 [archaeon]|nr:hypothetical protein [archaeon]
MIYHHNKNKYKINKRYKKELTEKQLKSEQRLREYIKHKYPTKNDIFITENNTSNTKKYIQLSLFDNRMYIADDKKGKKIL